MNSSRSRSCPSFFILARRATALLSALALLSATFGAGASAQRQQKPAPGERQRILHVLNRLGFGARPGDVERVRSMGLENYIREQLEPEKIGDAIAEAKVRELTTLTLSTAELYAKYPQPGQLLRQLERRGELPPELAALRDGARTKAAANETTTTRPGSTQGTTMVGPDREPAMPPPGDAPRPEENQEYRRAIRDYMLRNGLQPPQRIIAELQASRILRAVYSERQLQEVLVDFWTNHFNIFAGKGADRWLLVSYDRDTIRPHTLGKFKDLLVATAQSPAMLFYLDNFQSVSPNGPARRPMGPRAQQQMTQQQQQRPRRGINENYARELMELHTLGVDGGYTQKDVQEVARCFTGWTIINPRGAGGNMGAMMAGEAGTFYFAPRLHDDGEKVVLGHKIPAGGGIKDGLMVLDILARHPSTAKFIATKLARRFVTDEPTPQLVASLASAFTRSDGDIRETLRTLFASPDFNSPANYRAKIKTPFELAVSAIRTLGGETNGGPAIHQWIARMGEPLYGYQAPTGYPDKAENWVNTGALLERLNFGLALASNRIPNTRVDISLLAVNASTSSGADKERLINRFLSIILNNDVSPHTKAKLIEQMNMPLPTPAPSATTTTNNMDDVREARRGARRQQRELTLADFSASNAEAIKAAGLVLGTPEFQRQ